MRLQKAKSMPLRLEIMLEDAYYHVKPPASKRQKMKEKDPLELFTQHIIFDRLYKEEDEDKILKFVRKLPWDGPASGWLKKCLLDLNMHANFEGLNLIASLMSRLAKYRDAFVIDVIDSLFENVQATIERNDFREMPLRVRQVKLLGELYNYRLMDSNLVFDTMYMLIGFGGPTTHRAGQTATAHKILERALAARRAGNLGSISEEKGGEDAETVGQTLPPILADPQHPLEASFDYFRIKLVCVMLDTVGHYFDHGAVKQKLDRFLHFFIRYVHSKGEVPLRFMNIVWDTLDRLRPKLGYPATKAEAEERVLKLLKNERETLDLEIERDDERDEECGDDDSSDEEDSGSEDEEDSSNEEDDSDDEESDSEEDEDEAYDRGEAPDKTKHNEELDEFDKEVQQMLIDSLAREKHAPRVLRDLPLPPPSATRPEGSSEAGGFSLVQKRAGGKMLVKQLDVPDDSILAQVSRSSETEASREQRDLKRYIMHSVQTPTQIANSSFGSMGSHGIRLRAGKGSQKGNWSHGKSRRSTEYVRDEFLPESDDQPELLPPQQGRIIFTHKGAGRGSRGAGSSGSGGRAGPGKGRQRPEVAQRGTPSASAAKGVL